jgi:AAA domain
VTIADGLRDGREVPLDHPEEQTEEDLGLYRADTIPVRPVVWAWPNYIARREFNLLAGEGALGKSTNLLYQASRFSVGGPWPDGSSGDAPRGHTLILCAEDDPETTIVPRLMAMKADLSRITIMRARVITRTKEGKKDVSHKSLKDTDYFHRILDRRPDAVCLITDPIVSYIGRGVNDHRNNELRDVIEKFVEEVVRPRELAFLGNTHLNKTLTAHDKNPLHRIMGSVAYANLARVVAMIVRDPKDDLRRFYKIAKINQGPDDTDAIAFRIEGRTVVGPDGQQIPASLPVFETGLVPMTREQLAHAVAGGPDSSARDATSIEPIAEWLVEFLLPAPKKTREVFAAAGAKGLIGELKEDHEGRIRWSKGRYLYRARDLVNSGNRWRIEDTEDKEWVVLNP